ncbi:glycosyltransferase family protein [Roseobacter weihaiensis]|uniref:glycosyltransferase family protein n=1 Tax=Roseobacter weihaiensis TaxID=2763262 RepID=UPI001D0A0267|nr:glycosyltransferase [Roseobacter sp. H9]
MKVLIVVTHLLGSGHLARALVLGRAFAAAGHEITVVSGGLPARHLNAEGIDLVQLPPLQSDGTHFTRLLDDEGQPASQTLLTARQDKLRALLADQRPDVVITELFPFGRRVLAAEFRTLLEAAGRQIPKPLICASIRDILAPPSKPAKAASTAQMISDCYDAVLVHSDAALTPLGLSWPLTDAISEKLHYTGFVAQPPAGPHPQGLGTDRVLVSAGGGNVGQTLYQTAIEAARIDAPRQWHLLVGGVEAEARCVRLREQAPQNVTVEPARPDFRQMLHHASASVCLCGYNTALDVLQAGTPTVFVPFDDGGEVEQSLRAKALARLDGIVVLKSADLSASRLVQTLRAATASPPRPARTQGLKGAVCSVSIVQHLLERHRDEA